MTGFARTAAVVTLGAAGVFAFALPAAADGTPTVNGCPTGYMYLYVPALTAQGYHDPAIVDARANGGNGDDWVCGKPFSPAAATQLCGGPCAVPVLYEFSDNNRTPAFKS